MRWPVDCRIARIVSGGQTGADRGGLDAKMAEGALEMGVNIIYYSFSNYLELTRKYRK